MACSDPKTFRGIQEHVPNKNGRPVSIKKTEHEYQEMSKSEIKTDPVCIKKQNDVGWLAGWLAGLPIVDSLAVGLAGGSFRPLCPCSIPETGRYKTTDPVCIKKTDARLSVLSKIVRSLNKQVFGGARSVIF